MSQAMLLQPMNTGYAETIAWHTDTHRSRDGTEVRVALDDDTKPLHRIRTTIPVNGPHELRIVQNQINKATDDIVYVPLWLSLMTLTAPVSSPSLTINCSTVFQEVNNDFGVLLMSPNERDFREGETYDRREIDTFNTTSITLTATVDDYATGDWVLPVIPMTLQGDPVRNVNREQFGTVEMNFREIR